MTEPRDMQSASERVRRLLTLRRRNIVTDSEVIERLVSAAAICDPAELASELSEDWLRLVEAAVSNPPKSPDDGIFIFGVMGGPGFDPKAFYRAHAEEYFEATHKWNKFFQAKVGA